MCFFISIYMLCCLALRGEKSNKDVKFAMYFSAAGDRGEIGLSMVRAICVKVWTTHASIYS